MAGLLQCGTYLLDFTGHIINYYTLEFRKKYFFHLMIQKIREYYSQLSFIRQILLAIIGLLFLGIIDLIIGPEVSFSIFYLGPIFLAAWYRGRVTGILISTIAALIWLFADKFSGHEYSSDLIPFWNTMVRLGFFLISVNMLVTIRQKLELEEKSADTDSLTGLANSRFFYECLDSEAARSRRYNRPFTLAYIDLDNFKTVNDTKGHETGDEVLKVVSEIIMGNTRQTDTIARLGGDEFAGLFPETDFEAAGAMIRKISENLSDAMKKNSWPITFSIGVITYKKPLDTSKEMVKAADDLMYKVKKAGKNNIIHEQWGNAVANQPF